MTGLTVSIAALAASLLLLALVVLKAASEGVPFVPFVAIDSKADLEPLMRADGVLHIVADPAQDPSSAAPYRPSSGPSFSGASGRDRGVFKPFPSSATQHACLLSP